MIIPDGHDWRSLRIFFKESEFMTTSEMAQLAGVNPRTIRRWRHKLGITTPRPQNFRVHNRGGIKPVEHVTDKKIWCTKEWLTEMYINRKIGMCTLARITKSPVWMIWKRLRKFGIPTKPRVSDNPHCTKEWCIEQYEVLGLTLRQCAKLASINVYTFMEWLVKFEIHIRDQVESATGERNKAYGKPSHLEQFKKVSTISQAPVVLPQGDLSTATGAAS